MKAAEVLEAALAALTHADAEELARLAEQAREAALPESLAEREAVRRQHQALRRLLQLTRRNLRLLRGAYRDPGGYSAPRD